MKLAPILSAGLTLVVAVCGTDIGGDSKGDSYDSSVKQADEARKSGDLDAAVPLYSRALQANPNGIEAKLGLGQAYLSAGLATRPPPCSVTCSTRKRAIKPGGAALPWR